MKKIKSKKGQEEIVGFALIIIVVAVISLVFLSIILRSDKIEVKKSYEVETLLNSILSYTSECFEDSSLNSPEKISELIYSCNLNKRCITFEESDVSLTSCKVLEKDISAILKENQKINQEKIKGYSLIINQGSHNILNIKEGNITKSYRGYSQPFAEEVNISLTIYS